MMALRVGRANSLYRSITPQRMKSLPQGEDLDQGALFGLCPRDAAGRDGAVWRFSAFEEDSAILGIACTSHAADSRFLTFRSAESEDEDSLLRFDSRWRIPDEDNGEALRTDGGAVDDRAGD